MKFKKIVSGCALLLGLAGAVIYVPSLREPRAQASAPRIQPLSQVSVAAAGRVEPAGEEYVVASDVDGRLARVLVDEGDRVAAGQIVAELVNDDGRARIDIARAEIAEKQARLERLHKGSREEERREAAARLREAEVQLEGAAGEVRRREPLLERGAVSRSEFDLAARDRALAQARLDAAREQLALVTLRTRPEDLRLAEAELAAAEARLREFEAHFEQTLIRSPITGRVIHRWRKSGEPVAAAAQTPILSIGDVRRLMVRVDVDETDIARIHTGQPAHVIAEAYGPRKFKGKVVRIGQALGRKNVRSDEPTERVDKKILEVLVALDPGQQLPLGLRVDAFLE